jgi:hypothetical protein
MPVSGSWPYKLEIRITVWLGTRHLIFPVNFRPGNHIRYIERPHDLEALERGEDILLPSLDIPGPMCES